MKRIVPVLFLFFLPVVAEDSRAQEPDHATGSVRGTIELPPAGLVSRRERGARYRGMTRETQETSGAEAEVTNVVVYLEGPSLPGRAAASRKILDQRNATFVPHILPIVKGETVDITNRDKTYHNVFSLSSPKKFNIGRRPTGEAVPVRFDQGGVVQVFCDIHSNMTAFIVVLDNPFFVQPDRKGGYTIEQVPPGTYTIQVWHERYSSDPQKIAIQAGKAASADFYLEE